MWSVGCILAELLAMLKECSPTFLDRKPLFPGKSCFPLSPTNSKTEVQIKDGLPFVDSDQLSMILSVLGSPTEQDISFISDPKAIQYIQGFTKFSPVNFYDKYKGAPQPAIEFLKKCLTFNPFFRVTLNEAIKDPIFDEVKTNLSEKYVGKSVVLDFESDKKLDIQTLRALFNKELALYN